MSHLHQPLLIVPSFCPVGVEGAALLCYPVPSAPSNSLSQGLRPQLRPLLLPLSSLGLIPSPHVSQLRPLLLPLSRQVSLLSHAPLSSSATPPAAAAQLPDERVCLSEAAAGIQARDHAPRRLRHGSLRRCIPDAAVVAPAATATDPTGRPSRSDPRTPRSCRR